MKKSNIKKLAVSLAFISIIGTGCHLIKDSEQEKQTFTMQEKFEGENNHLFLYGQNEQLIGPIDYEVKENSYFDDVNKLPNRYLYIGAPKHNYGDSAINRTVLTDCTLLDACFLEHRSYVYNSIRISLEDGYRSEPNEKDQIWFRTSKLFYMTDANQNKIFITDNPYQYENKQDNLISSRYYLIGPCYNEAVYCYEKYDKMTRQTTVCLGTASEITKLKQNDQLKIKNIHLYDEAKMNQYGDLIDLKTQAEKEIGKLLFEIIVDFDTYDQAILQNEWYLRSTYLSRYAKIGEKLTEISATGEKKASTEQKFASSVYQNTDVPFLFSLFNQETREFEYAAYDPEILMRGYEEVEQFDKTRFEQYSTRFPALKNDGASEVHFYLSSSSKKDILEASMRSSKKEAELLALSEFVLGPDTLGGIQYLIMSNQRLEGNLLIENLQYLKSESYYLFAKRIGNQNKLITTSSSHFLRGYDLGIPVTYNSIFKIEYTDGKKYLKKDCVTLEDVERLENGGFEVIKLDYTDYFQLSCEYANDIELRKKDGYTPELPELLNRFKLGYANSQTELVLDALKLQRQNTKWLKY